MSGKEYARYQFLFAQHAQAILDCLRRDVWQQPRVSSLIADKITGFDLIANNDPTRNDERRPYRYLQWIIRHYLKSWEHSTGIKLEDLYKIRDDLEIFEAHKKTLPVEERDIGLYDVKALSKKALALHGINIQSGKDLRREAKQKVMEETTVLYDGPEGMVVVPHTMSASCFWGRGTKWCISATKADNAFHQYNDAGPLIIFLPSKSGERYLSHSDNNFEIYNSLDEPCVAPESVDAMMNHLPKSLFVKHPIWYGNPTRLEADVLALRLREFNNDVGKDPSLLQDFNYIRESLILTSGRSYLLLKDLPIAANPDLIRLAVSHYGPCLEHVPYDLRTYDVARMAVVNSGSSMSYVPYTLLAPEQYWALAELAVSQAGEWIKQVDFDLQDDPRLVKIAAKNDIYSLSVVDGKFSEDPEFVKELAQEGCDIIGAVALNLIDPEILKDWPQDLLNQVAALAVKESLNILATLPELNIRITPEIEWLAFDSCRNDPDRFQNLKRDLHFFPSLRKDYLSGSLTEVYEAEESLKARLGGHGLDNPVPPVFQFG